MDHTVLVAGIDGFTPAMRRFQYVEQVGDVHNANPSVIGIVLDWQRLFVVPSETLDLST